MDGPAAPHHSAAYVQMQKHFLKSLNAYAIVLSILLTCSYQGFLQFPKPLNTPDYRSVNFSVWEKLFVYFNVFSLFFSVTGLLLFASNSFFPLLALAPQTEDRRHLDLLALCLSKYLYVILFFNLSLIFAVLGFVFAGLATVAGRAAGYCAVFVPAAIGGFIYLQTLVVSIKDVWQLISNMRANTELWEVMRKSIFLGHWINRWLNYFCRLRNQHDTSSLNHGQREYAEGCLNQNQGELQGTAHAEGSSNSL